MKYEGDHGEGSLRSLQNLKKEKNLAEHVILRKNGRIRETFVKIRGQQYKVIVYGEKAVSDVFAYDVDEGVPKLYQFTEFKRND